MGRYSTIHCFTVENRPKFAAKFSSQVIIEATCANFVNGICSALLCLRFSLIWQPQHEAFRCLDCRWICRVCIKHWVINHNPQEWFCCLLSRIQGQQYQYEDLYMDLTSIDLDLDSLDLELDLLPNDSEEHIIPYKFVKTSEKLTLNNVAKKLRTLTKQFQVFIFVTNI